jgi:hypothetical protein
MEWNGMEWNGMDRPEWTGSDPSFAKGVMARRSPASPSPGPQQVVGLPEDHRAAATVMQWPRVCALFEGRRRPAGSCRPSASPPPRRRARIGWRTSVKTPS